MNPKSSISSFPILFGYVSCNCVFICNVKHIINAKRFFLLARISTQNVFIWDVPISLLEYIGTTMHCPIKNTGVTCEYD